MMNGLTEYSTLNNIKALLLYQFLISQLCCLSVIRTNQPESLDLALCLKFTRIDDVSTKMNTNRKVKRTSRITTEPSNFVEQLF